LLSGRACSSRPFYEASSFIVNEPSVSGVKDGEVFFDIFIGGKFKGIEYVIVAGAVQVNQTPLS
jgi:hypothetical protein